MKEAKFNPAGENLWVTIKMNGLYYITYTFKLWGTDGDPNPVLTNPIRSNNNKVKVDDYYRIENEYRPNEPIAKHHGRVVSIEMDIWKLQDDNGYDITITVWQASNDQIRVINDNLYSPGFVPPVQPLAEDNRNDKVGKKNLKEEKFSILLTDITV